MKILEVTIPDEVFGVLSSLTNHQNKFVLEAIREKVEREIKRKLAKETIGASKQDSSVKSKKLRPFGLRKGDFLVPEDFDSPLPEEVLADFEN